ncbi:MAG TPA: insulinase family protein [Caulobacteraceae bacterium]
MRPSILAALLTATLLASPAVSSAAPVRPEAWPQAGSDVPADPAIRFGVLPNGMRYAVMRNATPAGQTSIRLRIGSGSLEESEAQQGLAHVLEHMAFEGSKHVPRGQMIKILERDGLAFGPDTNAETEWTQTVYQLDLPKSDPAMIDTGLMLFRETASELLIDPKALDAERGIVLSEERLRDTPAYRAAKAQIGLLAEGQRIVDRFPIGKVEVIKTAPASLIRQFYEANYRPDRATLIVVGDFDPAAVESQIRAHFGGWTPIGPETRDPDLGQVAKRGLTVRVVDLPGAQTLTTIAWARPYDDAPDTRAKRRRDTIEALALAVLNRRLGRLALGSNPPFLAAEAGFENLLHSDKVAVIEASSAAGSWKPALASADQEVRRLVEFGVSAPEIAQEVAQSRAALVNAETGAGTRPTRDLATALVEAVDSDQVFSSPTENLALFDEAVKAISPEEVSAAARRIFAGAGPLVEVESPTPIDGGEKAVAEAFAASSAVPVIAPAAATAAVWPYADFGKPGAVVSRHLIDDLGATVVRFANGVTLTVKPTDFRKDQVLVDVDIGHGREDLPRQGPSLGWAVPALIDGGFAGISLEDSQRALAGRIFAAQLSLGDAAFQIQGATRPKDLATQMQVLAAYVAHPGFRPAAFERLRQSYLQALPQLAATPEGVVRRDAETLLHGGDPRWAIPTAAELHAAGPDDLKALLAPELAGAPIEITIVGDVTVAEAIAETAATLGALPPRPASTPIPAGGDKTAFPAATSAPLILTDGGRADQAMTIVAWPVTDFYESTRASRAAMLAGEVLQGRVLDKVRLAEGATYSPEVQVSLSETFPHYGMALAAVEMPPQKAAGFLADVEAITASLRDKGVSADELERARNPRLATLQKSMLTNEYWLIRLAGSVADPRRLDIIRTTIPDYTKVTAAEVQAAAKRYFQPGRAWKLEVKAATTP